MTGFPACAPLTCGGRTRLLGLCPPCSCDLSPAGPLLPPRTLSLLPPGSSSSLTLEWPHLPGPTMLPSTPSLTRHPNASASATLSRSPTSAPFARPPACWTQVTHGAQPSQTQPRQNPDCASHPLSAHLPERKSHLIPDSPIVPHAPHPCILACPFAVASWIQMCISPIPLTSLFFRPSLGHSLPPTTD